MIRRLEERPLDPDDIACVLHLAHEVPAAFAALDPDMLVAYVRTYSSVAKERLQKTARHVSELLEWRSKVSYSVPDSLRHPPPRRSEFERLYQAGPIGRDVAGRAVIIERLGSIPAKELCEAFTVEEVVQHSVYNREAAIALNRSLSHQSGRLIQRITPILDLGGFGWDHLSRDFIARTEATIRTLLHACARRPVSTFTCAAAPPCPRTCSHARDQSSQTTEPCPLADPDSTTGFYIINAPSLFTLSWKLVRGTPGEHDS